MYCALQTLKPGNGPVHR